MLQLYWEDFFMYCIHCGNKIDDNAYVCIHCGKVVRKYNNNKKIKVVNKDDNSIHIIGLVFGLLSFFLIAGCYWKDISYVGMYTKFYEKLFYAFSIVRGPLIFAILGIIFSLKKKRSIYSNIGLGFSLFACFLIIAEIVVILVY